NSGTINNSNTTYTFRATYSDPDNDKPYAVQVVYGDKAYNMREADYTDTDYTDGKAYIYLAKLPLGTTSYYFRAADGSSPAVSTTPANSPNVTQSTDIIDVLVSQVGYGANDFKNAI